MKFKVGDKIRFVKNIGNTDFDWTIGRTGTVLNPTFLFIDSRYQLEIRIDGNITNTFHRILAASSEEIVLLGSNPNSNIIIKEW